MTRLRTFGSILPPQSKSTTRLSANSFSFPDRHAASGVAAAPSTTLFSNSTIRRIAKRDLFLGHSDDDIDKRSRDVKRIRPDLRNGEAIGECGLNCDFCRFACFKRSGKTGDILRFDRDNLDVRSQRFDGQRNSGDQTGAAHRNDDRIEIRNLLNDFEAHRSLAGDDGGIIVAVDVSETFFLSDFMRARFRFAEICSVEDDIRAEFLTSCSP